MRSPGALSLRDQLLHARDQVRRVVDVGRRAEAAWNDAKSFHAHGIAARARRKTPAPPDSTGIGGNADHVDADTRTGGDGELWHDDKDRSDAVRTLHHGFALFCTDAAPGMTPSAPPSRRQWWTAEVIPTIEKWCAFVQGQEVWAKRTATEWSTYEDWLDELRDLRSQARAHGLVLRSPEPQDLPETLHQRAATGRGSDGEAWWTLGRVAVYTTVGALGVLALW